MFIVKSLGFLQQEVKPVDLRYEDGQVARIAVPRQMEGYFVQWKVNLPPVHPVHEGKDQDPTYEERQED